jgi:hypothetical protein
MNWARAFDALLFWFGVLVIVVAVAFIAILVWKQDEK